jgi:hypothetical protein
MSWQQFSNAASKAQSPSWAQFGVNARAQNAQAVADERGAAMRFAAAMGIRPAAPAAAPAPLPQLSLETSPSYLAYLRSIGLREEDARATAARQQERVLRDVAAAVPDIQERGIETRRGIGEGFETRGVFRSGERLRKQALQQRDETKQIAGVYQQGADTVSDLNFERDQTISALSRERAERAAQTTEDITKENAYNANMRRLGLL